MEIKSKYLEAFKEASRFIKLPGNKLLVERIEQPEARTAGGIIIAENSNIKSDIKSFKPLIAMVIAVGEGYLDTETNSMVEMETKPGSIVLLNPNGATFFSTVPGLDSYSDMKLGISSEGDIQMRFDDMEAFNSYKEALRK